MKKLFLLLSIAVLSTSVHAAVDVGENLIINGSFDAEQIDFPGFWNPSSEKQVSYLRTGGPEGKKPAVVLNGDDHLPVTLTVRQEGLLLVEGGIYKLSAMIKTRGYKSSKGGLIVNNNSWIKEDGLMNLPADSDWTYAEKTFTLFSSENNAYGIAFFAKNLSGEIAIADVKLEAISEDALQGSVSQLALITAPRLIPLTPLLNRIPLANPELTFQFYGELPQTQDAYECLVTISDNRIPQQTVPLLSGKINVNFTGLPLGNHTLEAILRHRETQETVLSVAYPISIVDFPEVDRSAIKPLNMLVSELLNQPINTASGEQALTFDTPRDGWVFVALVASSPTASDLKVTLDGNDTVITETTDRLEAFRYVEMGRHRVTVSGGNLGMHLLVRSIPEIFTYPACVSFVVKENGLHDWAFMKKHVLYAVTTLNGGGLPGDALPDAKARGLRWLTSIGMRSISDPVEVRTRIESNAGMTAPQYDGFTSDELYFSVAMIGNYTQALKELHNPDNRLIYTWIVGKPIIPSLHTDFISACLNASNGRGRLLFEAYCHPQADEKMAASYLDDMLNETMRRFNTFFPNAVASTGIIFGNFNQPPFLSLEHNPAVDYKYFLDMQVNRLANHSDFKNLATVGYWGTYYGDEELARWSFKLMRHYAVEGRKDMLSDQYGFTYALGFLKNGDFVDGPEGWSLMPATQGSIRTETLPGYGKASQGRWYAGSAGDTVCVMTRQTASTNRISQTARGLTAGKAYCLQFVTADYTDITKKNYNPRRYGIDVELDGVDPIAEKSFVHIDTREKNISTGKTNIHRIVFRAESPEQTFTFNDAEALPGEVLCINFIQLKPYFE